MGKIKYTYIPFHKCNDKNLKGREKKVPLISEYRPVPFFPNGKGFIYAGKERGDTGLVNSINFPENFKIF